MSKTTAAADAKKAPPIETLKLQRPITGFEGPINVLEFREPTYGDFVDIGEVSAQIGGDFVDNKPTTLEIRDDHERGLRWMTKLTGHDQNILRQMSIADGRAAQALVKKIIRSVDAGN